MDITWEGALFMWKLIALFGIAGFSFTAGMWCFCKGFGWAPVNLTVNSSVNCDND